MYLSSLILAYPLRHLNDILRCSIWQDNAFFLSNSSRMPSFYARSLCDLDPLLILDDTGQMLSFYSVALLLLSTEGWRQRKDGEGERERARERISGLTKLLRDLEKEKSLCSVLAVQLRGDMKQITRWRWPSTSFTLERPTLVPRNHSASFIKGSFKGSIPEPPLCSRGLPQILLSQPRLAYFISLFKLEPFAVDSHRVFVSSSLYILCCFPHRKYICVQCFSTKTCILFINRYLC